MSSPAEFHYPPYFTDGDKATVEAWLAIPWDAALPAARTTHERTMASDDRRFTADWMRREGEMREAPVGPRRRAMTEIEEAAYRRALRNGVRIVG